MQYNHIQNTLLLRNNALRTMFCKKIDVMEGFWWDNLSLNTYQNHKPHLKILRSLIKTLELFQKQYQKHEQTVKHHETMNRV